MRTRKSAFVGQQISIPIQIEIAGRHWEEHELGAYILQYAPRAFENTALQ